MHRSLKNWHEKKLSYNSTITIRDLAKRMLLDAIYSAAIDDPNAEYNLRDPNGELRYKVNQLMNGFNREVGLDKYLAPKVVYYERIFGIIT